MILHRKLKWEDKLTFWIYLTTFAIFFLIVCWWEKSLYRKFQKMKKDKSDFLFSFHVASETGTSTLHLDLTF